MKNVVLKSIVIVINIVICLLVVLSALSAASVIVVELFHRIIIFYALFDWCSGLGDLVFLFVELTFILGLPHY